MVGSINLKRETFVVCCFIVFGAILISVRSTPFVKKAKQVFFYVFYQDINTIDYVMSSTGDFMENIKNLIYANEENKKYKEENKELKEKLYNYTSIKKDYDNLLDFLKISPIREADFVFARVLIREPSEYFRWLVIDKGSKDGLRNDLSVGILKKDGFLCVLGRIVETHKDSSKVGLITNPISAVAAKIDGKGIDCLAEGDVANILKITHIPASANVKVGDEILVSEMSNVFQRGMSIGTITSLSEESSLYFKTAFAMPSFKNELITEVIVFVPKEMP
jgi:rod shape-determining protein MreC